MGLSSRVSEINSDFSGKSQNFHKQRVFCAPADGVFLELVIGAQSHKKTRMVGLGDEKDGCQYLQSCG